MAMELEFPRPVADLCAALAGQGFDVLDERYTGGGLVLILQGPAVVDGEWMEAFVRVAERDGRWSICLRFEGMANWITARAWEAYLDGTEPDVRDLAGRAHFVRYRLADAARAIRATPHAERVLVRLTERQPG
ncbi:MAG TPA: hypothetical protein VGX25_20720 [Actinophytocola sp.]|uniref:hypothetical protein n=1 Tax=Actinophytocola sp. TaxID=1872138 RepID=UPI002DDCFC40|nr:hypothetical protein [Actinophytocola sp.]HEV2781817.1 hypothetical protein [Actinophytocola sp.]